MSEVRGAADLSALPFTTKSELAAEQLDIRRRRASPAYALALPTICTRRRDDRTSAPLARYSRGLGDVFGAGSRFIRGRA